MTFESLLTVGFLLCFSDYLPKHIEVKRTGPSIPDQPASAAGSAEAHMPHEATIVLLVSGACSALSMSPLHATQYRAAHRKDSRTCAARMLGPTEEANKRWLERLDSQMKPTWDGTYARSAKSSTKSKDLLPAALKKKHPGVVVGPAVQTRPRTNNAPNWMGTNGPTGMGPKVSAPIGASERYRRIQEESMAQGDEPTPSELEEEIRQAQRREYLGEMGVTPRRNDLELDARLDELQMQREELSLAIEAEQAEKGPCNSLASRVSSSALHSNREAHVLLILSAPLAARVQEEIELLTEQLLAIDASLADKVNQHLGVCMPSQVACVLINAESLCAKRAGPRAFLCVVTTFTARRMSWSVESRLIKHVLHTGRTIRRV